MLKFSKNFNTNITQFIIELDGRVALSVVWAYLAFIYGLGPSSVKNQISSAMILFAKWPSILTMLIIKALERRKRNTLNQNFLSSLGELINNWNHPFFA
jgi:membrane protein implicated in regulation of membrane protease activity